jgi:NAD(P)-dependent dehydrogenase (short-subunit alcohol dehydrogenase family)
MLNTENFSGRKILLAGATSGLGCAIARGLAQMGASLILTGRDQNRLNELKQNLTGSHQAMLLDLSDPQQIESQLNQDLLKDLYGICFCAGVVETRPLKLMKPVQFLQHMQVNSFSALELARLLTQKQFMPAEGSLVFVTSIYSTIGAPGQSAYCASKGALAAASRALAVELAPRNIRVNCIAPGFVATDMTMQKSRLSESQLQAIVDKHPLGAGSEDQVARAAAFLLSPANRWITGTELCVDGGYTAQ